MPKLSKNDQKTHSDSDEANAIISSVFGSDATEDLSPDNELGALLAEPNQDSKPTVVVEHEVADQEIHKQPAIEDAVVEHREDDSTNLEIEEADQTNKEKPRDMANEQCGDDKQIRFLDLPLLPEVQNAVKLAGYDHPTPVQAEIIPHLLDGRDVLAQSQTGTGKTAAFALPLLTRIEVDCKTPQVLVLTPTRELAIQVAKSFETYGANVAGFQHAVIYGGQDYEIQFRQLKRGPQVVVGTPGRVIDHIKRGSLDIGEIECLVLDEADEMLNMGFLDDVKFVLDRAPDHRQIALFSATLPGPIRTIATKYLNDPEKVTIRRKTMTADSIRQRAVFVSPRDRVDLLIRFLEAENADGVIVFTRTRESTAVVADKLARAGLRAAALNGEMPQRSRERTIQRLKAGQLDVLVATDVAARGLDVSRISHVFNFDFPEGSEIYIHRVGRTGRAGKTGEAIIFLTHSQRSKLRMVEKATRQPIEIVEPPTVAQINQMRIQKFFQAIDKTIAERDMSFFEKLISDYVAQSDEPVERIAAAIAMVGQNGRDFQMKERPKQERKSKSEKREHGGKRDRFSGSPEPGMQRFRIAVGKRDGVRPGNIVGAVTNEANLHGDEIGSIRIHESYTTVDLPEGKSNELIQLLQDTRVAGRPMNLRVADERDSHAPKKRNRSNNSKSRSLGDKSGFGKKREGRWQKSKGRDNTVSAVGRSGKPKRKSKPSSARKKTNKSF